MAAHIEAGWQGNNVADADQDDGYDIIHKPPSPPQNRAPTDWQQRPSAFNPAWQRTVEQNRSSDVNHSYVQPLSRGSQNDANHSYVQPPSRGSQKLFCGMTMQLVVGIMVVTTLVNCAMICCTMVVSSLVFHKINKGCPDPCGLSSIRFSTSGSGTWINKREMTDKDQCLALIAIQCTCSSGNRESRLEILAEKPFQRQRISSDASTSEMEQSLTLQCSGDSILTTDLLNGANGNYAKGSQLTCVC